MIRSIAIHKPAHQSSSVTYSQLSIFNSSNLAISKLVNV